MSTKVIYIYFSLGGYRVQPSVLWRCWLGSRKGIRPVKKLEWWGTGMVICLERDADLHMAQQMPLPLIVSCFSKIQIGFTFLVPAHLGSPGKGPLNGCVCGRVQILWLACLYVCQFICLSALTSENCMSRLIKMCTFCQCLKLVPDDSCVPPVLWVVACFHIQITKHGSNNFGYRAKSASLDRLVMKWRYENFSADTVFFGTGCRQRWSCCSWPTPRVASWKHFSFRNL